jgi:hypothetical protein
MAMPLLKQMQRPLVRERHGKVGNRGQLPAPGIVERARALDPIERKKAAMILESFARAGARDPGRERGR